jgi:hypothetical protein
MKHMIYKSHLLASSLILLGSIFAASPALGQSTPVTDGEYIKNVSRKLSIGLAVGYERFDTSFKFTEKSSGISAFIDGEGTLGLPEIQTVPIIYGYWRPSIKHGLGFSSFRINRVATLLAFNENLGDLTLTGRVTLTDKSRFYYLSYNYTLYNDDRSFVFLSFGAYGLHLRYQLDASGAISVGGAPIASGEFSSKVSVFAPLPMIGIDSWFALTPRWAIGAKVSVVGGEYADVSAAVVDSRIQAKYAFNKNVGLSFGINYFQGEIKIDKDDFRTIVHYGFDGVHAGLDVGF